MPLDNDLPLSMFAHMKFSAGIIAVIITLASSHSVHAQVSSDAGIIAGGTWNLHSASFSKLDTFPSCCPEFTGGSGFGWYVGGWYSWPLTSSLALHGRLSASSESGLLSDQERSFVADLRDTAKVVDALFQHDLRATLISIGLEPLLAYRVTSGLDVLVGARVGFVATHRFHQTETLVEPADFGAYLGDDRVWVDTEADIPAAASMRLSAVAGIRYLLPMGPRKRSFLAPELMVHMPLTGVANGVQWSVTQVRLGIALGWSLVKDVDTVSPQPQQPPPPPPPVIAFTPPSAEVTLVCLDRDGTVMSDTLVRVEQTRVTTLHPLLGHVYFDEGRADVPERYTVGITRAQEDTLRLLPREALYGELYVIAQRMLRNPAAKIICTGTTSGTPSDQGLQLARSRAERIRDILISLGVPNDRIELAARNTPARMTTASDTADATSAIEENRRVEITSTSPDILAPLALGSIDVSARPSSFRITSTITSALPITSARVELRQGSRLLAQADHTQPTNRVLDVRLTPEDIAAMSDEPLIAQLALRDANGATAQDEFMLPVAISSTSRGRLEDAGDAQIERFQLILFDFNDVNVSGANARLLALIRSRISPTTQVRIIGVTDVLGSSEYNADLSLRRAREVARQLQVPGATIIGMGERDSRFDNGLPEGRAYNRTVIIELIHSTK